MNAHEKRLIEFAKATLAIMETDKEWSVMTFVVISKKARDLGLSDVGEDGFFAANLKCRRVAQKDCDHQTGYWINKPQGTFRCYKCGCQCVLEELPKMQRVIENWHR